MQLKPLLVLLRRKLKVWYKAVCDKHKEMIDIFVSNVATTYHYFHGPQGERSHEDMLINDWLAKHYDCSLRLIHNDIDMDKCFNDGYIVVKCKKLKI